MEFLKKYGWLLFLAVLFLAYLLFKAKIDSIIESFRSTARTIEDNVNERLEEQTPPVQQTIIVPVPVNPKPNPPHPQPVTCDQLKNWIAQYTNLVAANPLNQKYKATLDSLKQQYAAKNCAGGPGPLPIVEA